jgi:D-arabinose 5-phosphate isomerase GutQ
VSSEATRELSKPLSAMAEIVDNVKKINAQLEVIGGLDWQEFQAFTDGITSARRIALYRLGREGVMTRVVATRLLHLSYDVGVAAI